MDSFVSSSEFEAFKLQTNERFDRIENKMELILNLISERLPPASPIKHTDSPVLPVTHEFTFDPITPSGKKGSSQRQVNFSIGESSSSSNVTYRVSNAGSSNTGGNLGGAFENFVDQRAVISIPVFGETLKTYKLSDYLVFKKKLLAYNASYSQQVRLSRCLDLSLVQDIFASFPEELGDYNYNATNWISNSSDAEVEHVIGRLALPRNRSQYFSIIKIYLLIISLI